MTLVNATKPAQPNGVMRMLRRAVGTELTEKKMELARETGPRPNQPLRVQDPPGVQTYYFHGRDGSYQSVQVEEEWDGQAMQIVGLVQSRYTPEGRLEYRKTYAETEDGGFIETERRYDPPGKLHGKIISDSESRHRRY